MNKQDIPQSDLYRLSKLALKNVKEEEDHVSNYMSARELSAYELGFSTGYINAASNTPTLEVQQIQDSYIKGYEAGEWISVEDRLPESGEYVDVFALKTYESGAKKGSRYTEIEYYIDPVSKWADFIMPMQGLKITHWMYRPKPPKTINHE